MGNSVEVQLGAIRAELERLREAAGVQHGLPTVLTMARAAEELSRSLTTLKLMIRRQEILTVMIGKRRMVPASEVRRLATPVDRPTSRKEPARSALQDPEALRRRR